MRVLLSKDEIQELKAKGLVFASPLGAQLISIALLIALGLRFSDTALFFQYPASLADLARLLELTAWLLAGSSAVVVGARLALGLVLNGFFVSLGLLRPRLRRSPRTPSVVAAGVLVLGLGAGAAVCSFALGGLVTQMSATSDVEAIGVLRALSSTLGKRLVVASVVLAILAIGLGRFRYLVRRSSATDEAEDGLH